MCGKPLPTSFRTVPHSDTICRIFFGPETARFRRRCPPHGNHLFSVIAMRKRVLGVSPPFGGFLRPPRRSVLGMSAYAYQKASWLVPANLAIGSPDQRFGWMTDSSLDRSPPPDPPGPPPDILLTLPGYRHPLICVLCSSDSGHRHPDFVNQSARIGRSRMKCK